MKNRIYSVIESFSKIDDSIIIMFSTGKDAVVTLDLCCKYLKNIKPVYLYYFKDLKYRENYIKKVEDLYGLKIERLPHPELSKYYKIGVFGCQKIRNCRIVSMTENDNILREKYNIKYVAYGYKGIDSLQRRGMIKNTNDTGIDEKIHKIYPVAHFSHKMIFDYIERNKLLLPPEYKSGFRDINTFFEKDSLRWLISNYPEDYEKIKEQFPLIDGVLLK